MAKVARVRPKTTSTFLQIGRAWPPLFEGQPRFEVRLLSRYAHGRTPRAVLRRVFSVALLYLSVAMTGICVILLWSAIYPQMQLRSVFIVGIALWLAMRGLFTVAITKLAYSLFPVPRLKA
jgi:hypothetical protein